MQHQLIRIAVLGITGFDSPVAFKSIEEAGYSLEGMNEWYNLYAKKTGKVVNKVLLTQIDDAVLFTEKNSNFNEFDRLEFIKGYLMTISKNLEKEFQTVIDNTPNFNKNKVFYGTLSDLMQGRK